MKTRELTHKGSSSKAGLVRMFLKALPCLQGQERKDRWSRPAGRAPAAHLPACTAYLCSLGQVHHGVRLEVVLVLPAEHGRDDDDDDRDHGDGRQHRGDDPQVVGRVLHHSCGEEPAGSTSQGALGRERPPERNLPQPPVPSCGMVTRI